MKYGTVDDLLNTTDLDNTAPSSPLWLETPSQQTTLLARRYELKGLLGSGGAGSVFRARDLVLGEDIALKVLKRVGPKPEEALEQLRHEVRLARRVTHRSIARVYDLVDHEGFYFLTMEYIDGLSLAKRMGRGRHRRNILSLPEVVTLTSQIAEGLSAAHVVDIVHCDLKPDNILLSRDGRTIITDFGIARKRCRSDEAEHAEGPVMGTPAYMSPEQVSGSVLDGRSDIYSIGVMMFEMLSGRLPFEGADGMTMALARQLADAPSLNLLRPDLPKEVVSLVARCLSRRPEERIATAEDLRSAVLSLPISVDQQSSRTQRPSVLEADSAGILPGESRFRVVALWPILNQGTPEQNDIAQGVADSLVDALSSVRGIRVIGRAAVARQRQQTPDPLDSARALGAQVLLCGSLSVQGQSLHAALRLHAVESGFQLWNRRWELPFGQALGLCQQTAQAVAAAMLTEMLAPQNDSPLDPETLALYLRARHLFTGSDSQFYQRSVELLEQALARQPDSPLLLVGHARACARLWFWGHMDDKQKAMSAAERAVQAAPNQAAPYSALGAVLYGSGQLVGAVRALRRALSIDPQLADAYDLLGRILCECGPLADAVEYLETALRLDPLSVRARLDMIRMFALSGAWKQVEVLLAQEVIDPRLVPMWWMMTGRLAIWRKDPALAKRFLALPGDESLSCQRGRRLLRMAAQEDQSALLSSEEMRRFFHTSERDNPRRRVIMFQAETEVHSYSGRADSALRTLQSSVDLGLTDIMWMDCCPLLSVIRDDPSYQGLRTIVADRAESLRAALESPLLP